MRRRLTLLHLVLIAAACTPSVTDRAEPTPAASPSAAPSASLPPNPVLYFNLSEADALDYLAHLQARALEALRGGDLGDMKDVYTRDGAAGRAAAAAVIEDFRNKSVNATEIDVLRTEIVSIGSQLAVFDVVRIVRPCVYDYDTNLSTTEDDRERREVARVYMADEKLNWRLDREVVRRSAPTGERVPCPPS